jgi:hypothetical protein
MRSEGGGRIEKGAVHNSAGAWEHLEHRFVPTLDRRCTIVSLLVCIYP